MTETQAFVIARAAILDALKAYGHTATQVLAGRQPSKQMLMDNAVYMFPIGEKTQAMQGRQYTRLGADEQGDAGHVERVRVSKTVQVQAFLKTDIHDTDAPTASDLCATVKMIVQSLPFQEAIREGGVAAYGATEMREPEFINDAGDYEKNPSFDFEMTFTREIKPLTGVVEILTPELGGI